MTLIDVHRLQAIIFKTEYMLLLPLIWINFMITGVATEVQKPHPYVQNIAVHSTLKEFPPPSAGVSSILASRRLRASEHLAEKCTKFDITVLQGETTIMPSGIPTFTVQIFNMCAIACPVSDIHIACGWFASAKLVNPKVFRRIKYNDCLLNDGKPVRSGESVTFQYSNSFQYPMSVLSISTTCW